MNSDTKEVVRIRTAIMTVLLAIICVVLASIFSDFVKGIIIAFWTVSVPSWFLIEYIMQKGRNKTGDEFDHFKYEQELARNIWLAILAILITLYFKEFKF